MASWNVRMAALMFAALTGAAGCMAAQSFMPAEHVTGLSPNGSQYAAEYRMQDKEGFFGEAKVWSRGVYRTDVDGHDQTVVHVGFAFDNVIDSPLRFDPQRVYLEDVVMEDGRIERVSPVRVNGDPQVPAGQEREIQVLFALPRDVWPSSVRAYRVVWSVTDGGRYSERTPFLRDASEYDDVNFGISIYGGYYSPFYWPHRYGPYSYPYYAPALRYERRAYPSAPYLRRR
jgi:hypothetical protein